MFDVELVGDFADIEKVYLTSVIGEKLFKVESRTGKVKVGNEDFIIGIPSGCEDEVHGVAMSNLQEKTSSDFNYLTSIEGKFNIYADGFGYDVAKTMEGRYGIYYNKGFVVFEK